MPDEFQYDVFLSHSAKDKAVVRPLAERLRADGVKVWFDEWVLQPGDSLSSGESSSVGYCTTASFHTFRAQIKPTEAL